MRTVLIPIALAFVAAGCAGGDGASDDGRATVVTAFFPLAEAARLVDPDADVVDLTPPGVEPHDLELTTDQVDELLDADLAVVLGGGFQPAVEDVADDRDGPTVRVLDDLDVDGDDPHVWLDPTVMAEIVGLIAEALRSEPPDVSSFAALDERFSSALSSCERDLIVASHDAYSRMASRYGLRLEAIEGLVPEAEPDAARLDELAELVERERVTTVFVEPLLPRAAAETLARETGASIAELDPLESDPGVSYIEAMDRNLDALREGLSCAG